MMLPRGMIAADGRHARTVLRSSDTSDLCPLPGAVASCQILQTSPPHKCPGGHDKDDDGYYEKVEEEDILVVETG